MFNDGDYWQRAKDGEFTEHILRDGHPTSPSAPEPHCTRSQYIAYIDQFGNTIAEVHQYVRPDGTLGASGRPSPHALMVDNIIYVRDDY